MAIIASKREELASRQTAFRKFTRHKCFEVAITAAIVCNTIAIGVQTQMVARRVEDAFFAGSVYDESDETFFFFLEAFFTCVFMVDIGLRWAAEGLIEFIFNYEWAWNCFDIVTVIVGMLQLLLECLQLDSALQSISVVRVLRVLRLVRLIKIIRVYTFFRELRMLVDSCLCGLKSYMWCCIVVFLLLYLFGISLTTRTYSYISREGIYSDDQATMELQESFGTLDKAMLSLFQAITGGRDWSEFYDMFDKLGLLDRLMFWVFLSFSTFAVFNAVAAVFVDSAMQSSQHDRELLIRERLADATSYRKEMFNVFEEMDADGTGTITLDEFICHLDDDRVRAYFETLKLDVSDAKSLFNLLDADRSGKVEIQEFIDGCHALKGEARTLDMHFLRFELAAVRKNIEQIVNTFVNPIMRNMEHIVEVSV